MAAMVSKIALGRGVKQRITNLYRQYKTGTLHMDYAKNAVRISIDGKDQGVLIFGEAGEVICKLANGEKTCSFQSIFDLVKAM